MQKSLDHKCCCRCFLFVFLILKQSWMLTIWKKLKTHKKVRRDLQIFEETSLSSKIYSNNEKKKKKKEKTDIFLVEEAALRCWPGGNSPKAWMLSLLKAWTFEFQKREARTECIWFKSDFYCRRSSCGNAFCPLSTECLYGGKYLLWSTSARPVRKTGNY